MKSIIILSGLFFAFPTTWAAKSTDVTLTWKYENFSPKLKIYKVKAEKEKYISETGIVPNAEAAPITTPISGAIPVPLLGSQALVLTVTNDSEKDLYFFAVPHELNPHHASAGHYFECLCIGRLFKVPPKKVWYRIVRINLNSSFQNIKSFSIDHKIIGVSKEDALGKYKDRIYE